MYFMSPMAQILVTGFFRMRLAGDENCTKLSVSVGVYIQRRSKSVDGAAKYSGQRIRLNFLLFAESNSP